MSKNTVVHDGTVGNHAVSGLVGIVNILDRYTADGLQFGAGDVDMLRQAIEHLARVYKQQEKAHAAGR